jgi:hypothetical protein
LAPLVSSALVRPPLVSSSLPLVSSLLQPTYLQLLPLR